MDKGNLIVTRRVGESIIIDGDIEITIAGVDRGQVRLSCKGPKNVSINRSEIQDKINAANGGNK